MLATYLFSLAMIALKKASFHSDGKPRKGAKAGRGKANGAPGPSDDEGDLQGGDDVDIDMQDDNMSEGSVDEEPWGME